MATQGLQVLVLAALLGTSVTQDDPMNPVGYDEKYVEGVNWYTAQHWKRCIPYFKQSVEKFSRLEEARLVCYTKCSQQSSKVSSDISGDEELLFFHMVLQRSHCVRHCLEEGAGPMPTGGVPHFIVENMKKWEGLNFLQEAYNKLRRVVEAAQAAAQYLYYNPHDEFVKANIKHYQHYIDVTKDDLRPHTTFEYRESYMKGHRLFYAEDWEGMVGAFEGALPQFYSALDQCRRNCEGPLKFTSTLGFSQCLAVVHSALLSCQSSCSQALGMFRSDRSEDFFGSFFHYLQYGYYFLNRSKDAVEASATQVRLDPGNEEAKRTSVFYKLRPGVTSKNFKPRKDDMPEILKHESVQKYRKLLHQLSGDPSKVKGQEEVGGVSSSDDKDRSLLEGDYMRWPVYLEHSTSRTTAAQ